MKTTIRDIAKEAKVSVSTVSLVLNNKPCRISQATRELVLRIAKKHNYQVNQAARSLITKETKIIGMIIPDIENIFFSSLSKKIEEYCSKEGYMLIIVNNNDREEDDIKLLEMVISRGVDGLLITPSNESLVNGKRVKEILSTMNIPYVFVDRYFEDFEANRVFFDNFEGANQAVSILVENGHEKIGCIAGGKESKNGVSRVQGYKKAMEDNNLKIEKEHIYTGNYRFEGGYEAGLKVLATDLTAIFICNDMMALGFIQCMKEHNKKIPEDISVVSYDNTLTRFSPWIQVCSVDQDVNQLALSSCELLFSFLKKTSHKMQSIRLHPTLIPRNSIKKIKR